MIGMTLLSVGTSDRKKLDAIRHQIETTHTAIDTTSEAPLPIADAMQRLMQRLQPHIDNANRSLELFARPDVYPLPQDSISSNEHPLIISMAAYAVLDPKAFESRITAMLSKASSKAGLSPDERKKKINELKAKIEQLELDEEREICRLEAAGFVVERRVDVPIEQLFKVWNAA